MRRRSLPLLFVVAAIPTTAVAQPGPAALVGAWRARVADPVRGTAVIELVLGNDGSYQRTYRPEAYAGAVWDARVWRWEPGFLQLRWFRYEVAPRPAMPPPQTGTDTFVIEYLGPNAFRFRPAACTLDACWGTMRRAV